MGNVFFKYLRKREELDMDSCGYWEDENYC